MSEAVSVALAEKRRRSGPTGSESGDDARREERRELADLRLGEAPCVEVERDDGDRDAVGRAEEKHGKVDDADVRVADAVEQGDARVDAQAGSESSVAKHSPTRAWRADGYNSGTASALPRTKGQPKEREPRRPPYIGQHCAVVDDRAQRVVERRERQGAQDRLHRVGEVRRREEDAGADEHRHHHEVHQPADGLRVLGARRRRAARARAKGSAPSSESAEQERRAIR